MEEGRLDHELTKFVDSPSAVRYTTLLVSLLLGTRPDIFSRYILIPMVVIWLPVLEVLVEPGESTYIVFALDFVCAISQICLGRFNDAKTYLVILFMVGLIVIITIWFGYFKTENHCQEGFWIVIVISSLWTIAIEGSSTFIYIIMSRFKFDIMKSLFAAILSRYTVFTVVNYYYKPFD